MITNERIRELRQRAGLRQEDIAFLLGVGIASINRWERPGSSLPTGLAREIFDVMDVLDLAGIGLAELPGRLRAEGSLATVRWLLNRHHQLSAGA